MTMHPCSTCDGTGMEGDYICSGCDGKRYFYSPYSKVEEDDDDD